HSNAACHWRVASEKCRHGMPTDWLTSSLKDRASSRLRLMENAYPLHIRRSEWCPRDHSINSHLENGRAVRYSGHMSTHCATAAPMRHPPGEARSLPALAPLVTTFAAGPLPANRECEVAARRLAAH